MCSMRGIDLHIDLAIVYAKDYKCMHYCAKPLFQRQMNILPLLKIQIILAFLRLIRMSIILD